LGDAGDDEQRIARLEDVDKPELPSGGKAIGVERQLIEAAEDEAVAGCRSTRLLFCDTLSIDLE